MIKFGEDFFSPPPPRAGGVLFFYGMEAQQCIALSHYVEPIMPEKKRAKDEKAGWTETRAGQPSAARRRRRPGRWRRWRRHRGPPGAGPGATGAAARPWGGVGEF